MSSKYLGLHITSALVLAATAACFEDPVGGDSKGTEVGTEEASDGATTETEAEAETESEGTADGTTDTDDTTDATTEDSEDSEDSETGPEPLCGDGKVDPGELCLSELPTEYTAGINLQDGFALRIAVGEFDAGAMGVAVAAGQAQLRVLRGDGDGELFGPEFIAISSVSDSVAVGDLEPDGDMDLVAGGGPLTALRNDGSGGWDSVEIDVGFSVAAYPVALGQLDATPQLDVVFGDGYNTVWVRGSAQEGWSGGQVDGDQYTGGDSWTALTEFGFDGDGFTDMLVASRWTAHVEVLRGGGNATFTAQGQVVVCDVGTCELTEVHAADLDGDGNPDILASFESGFSVMLGKDDGTFEPFVLHALPGADHIDSADIDNDGDLDIVVASRADGNLRLLLGHGDGGFDEPILLTVPGDSTQTVEIVDMDGDGAMEVVTGYASRGSTWVGVFTNDP